MKVQANWRQEGLAAAMAGQPFDSNPYPANTLRAIEWEWGWKYHGAHKLDYGKFAGYGAASAEA